MKNEMHGAKEGSSQSGQQTSSGISRRRFLAGAGATAAAMAAPMIITRRADAAPKLVFALWGGAFRDAMVKAFFEPFEKETGIRVLAAGVPDLAKLTAQVKSGNTEWDLIVPANSWEAQGVKEGLWEPIDYSNIDMTDAPAQMKRPYSLGYAVYAGGMDWNEDRNGGSGKHPQSWPEFWDVKKFPGRRGLKNRPGEMLEIALMADGVPSSELYPLDVDRAFKSLDHIKPHVRKWIHATSQTITLVQNNVLDFSYTYNGRAFSAREAGLPIGFSFKQNVLLQLLACVIKGTPNKGLAMRLLAFMMRRDRQAAFATLLAYTPARRNAVELVDPKVRKFFPDLKDPNNVWFNIDYWGKHNATVEPRFKQWLLM